MGVDISEFLTSITLKFQQDLFAKDMVLSSCPQSISTHAVLAKWLRQPTVYILQEEQSPSFPI
jgi:hypothetical protein